MNLKPLRDRIVVEPSASDLFNVLFARYPELDGCYVDLSDTYVRWANDKGKNLEQLWKCFQKNGRNITVESLKYPEMTVDPPNTASNKISAVAIGGTSNLSFVPNQTAGGAYSSTTGSWGTKTSWTGMSEDKYLMTDLDRYTQTLKEKKMSVQKRLVKIFVVDPNENVPMEDSIVWQKECLTDETDVELLQQIGMVEILARHNAKRTTVLDKTRSIAAEKDIFLEPAKLRDVVARVITVVVF